MLYGVWTRFQRCTRYLILGLRDDRQGPRELPDTLLRTMNTVSGMVNRRLYSVPKAQHSISFGNVTLELD